MIQDWAAVAIQAGGAALVCWMFLYFLTKKQVADEVMRREFLLHLKEKDDAALLSTDKHIAYLRERDAQSKEIALSGHRALSEVASHLTELREEVIRHNLGGD